MDDTYKINTAITEMREAYNGGDTTRLLSPFFIPMGSLICRKPVRTNTGAKPGRNLAEEAARLFASYSVRFVPIVAEISLMDSIAFDRGWQEFVLTPKNGGEQIRKRYRYFNVGKRLRPATGRSPCTSTIRTFPRRSAGFRVRGS